MHQIRWWCMHHEEKGTFDAFAWKTADAVSTFHLPSAVSGTGVTFSPTAAAIGEGGLQQGTELLNQAGACASAELSPSLCSICE